MIHGKKIKRAAIIQPNFFPWIGYFEIIKFVDIFFILDDVQYTKRDWRNKNIINNSGRKLSITIPVHTKNKYLQRINETQISSKNWKNEIIEKIKHSYKKTKNFNEVFNMINFILNENEKYLFKLSFSSILEVAKYLEIKTDILLTSNFGIDSETEKNDRIIKICKKMNVTNYLTGPSAMNYLMPEIFKKENITLEVIKYKKQINYITDKKFLFLDKLSIIDLLFNQGKQSKEFLQEINFENLN